TMAPGVKFGCPFSSTYVDGFRTANKGLLAASSAEIPAVSVLSLEAAPKLANRLSSLATLSVAVESVETVAAGAEVAGAADFNELAKILLRFPIMDIPDSYRVFHRIPTWRILVGDCEHALRH